MTAEEGPAGASLVPEQLRALLSPCREAMREAGAVVLEVYRSAFAVERKGDLTPVTEADRRSDRLLSQRLAALPVGSAAALPVLSEEGSHPPFGERRGWRRLWLVDPLDGTKEFVKRSGEFTINVALVEDRAAVLGLVYAPLQDLFYWGGPALGAWRQEAGGEPRPLPRAAPRTAGGEPWPLPREIGRRAVSSAKPRALPGTLLAPDSPPLRVLGSRSFSGLRFRRYVRQLRRLAGEVEVVLMGGSLKMCLVAEGRADLYPRFGPSSEWDTAAPHAVLAGVGRRIRRLDSGEELTYNKESLANPWFVAG